MTTTKSSASTAAQEQDVVRIFDTTLRDGEQCPGASLNTQQKIEIARALELLNVDVIEAGFPIASPGDFEAVQAVSEVVHSSRIAGLARCTEKDIQAAADALKNAAKKRIHVFCATSEIHMKYKLKKSREEVLRMSTEHTRFARSLVDDVEFSAEDATRSDPGFLAEVVSAVIEAGATTVNIPDTVGYTVPDAYYELISMLMAKVPNIAGTVISVHCHDDLGLAVANSLAAVRAGARQVECTINGLGERAGNCSLEEFVMALKVRNDHYKEQTQINSTRLYPTSRLVSTSTGMMVQRNKAIVGENAFAHESGIHQHGVLSNASTYEIISPADVGISNNKLVLGKHSGRHAFRDRLAHLGYQVDDVQIDKAFEQFKILADKKKDIYDEDICSIMDQLSSVAPSIWELEVLQTTGGTQVMPTATVRLKNVGGQVFQDAATGDGPIDAAYRAIQRICKLKIKLQDYQIRALTSGTEAQGEVNLEVQIDGQMIRGRGVSTDIIEASAQAYLSAVNRYLVRNNSTKKQ
ncbi:MAG: 2-isopropylmalate synthase [Phycisphaerae bacterium]|jgi:2-isopropylmalate synthase|nr:2-isopropylmalate synthase [Phycisphaerae bacterium]